MELIIDLRKKKNSNKGLGNQFFWKAQSVYLPESVDFGEI
jgi:hypothetical protein